MLVEEKARQVEFASKYKSEFMSNMSHELRTPLNSLLILSQLLSKNEEGNLTEKQVEFSRVIHSSGKDLLALINEILDLSKVEAGKMSLRIEDVHLDALASSLKQDIMPLVQEKGLCLNIKHAEGLPAAIRTDLQRVHQILKNLLSSCTAGKEYWPRRHPAESF